MDVAILVGDMNYNKVVDMFEVVAETLSSDVWVDMANDEVPSSTDTDFVGYMAWKYELSVVPGDFDLQIVSNVRDPSKTKITLLP